MVNLEVVTTLKETDPPSLATFNSISFGWGSRASHLSMLNADWIELVYAMSSWAMTLSFLEDINSTLFSQRSLSRGGSGCNVDVPFMLS